MDFAKESVKQCVDIFVDEKAVVIFSTPSFLVPDACKDAVAEFLIRANWQITQANFDFDFSDGKQKDS